MLSGNEALLLMLDSNMTKAAFQLHKNAAIARQCNLYSYITVKSSKRLCYPNNMIYTDYTANIPLQILCDHTAQRLYQVQNDVICMTEQCDLVTFDYKVGINAPTGPSIYKQKISVDKICDLQNVELLMCKN